MSLRNIVILTGAGISAESGLQTFRAAEGRIEALAEGMVGLRFTGDVKALMETGEKD